jgi:pimeloyl-ACP methyl ester carboxylesterase
MMTSTQAYLDIEGNRIAYTLHGDRSLPGLMLVHGWLSYGGVWRSVLDELSRHYCCASINLLGFGTSDKPVGGDYSIPAQGRRVLALADALGWDKFALMGHSMGGQISLCIASTLAPERIVRLVDVAGVTSGKLQPFQVWVTKTRTYAAMKLPFLRAFSHWTHQFPAFAKFEFSTWFYHMPPYEQWREDVPWATVAGIEHSAYPAVAAFQAYDLTPYLHQIEAPTLVIFGRRDAVVPPLEGDLVARCVPGARLIWFEDCGHFPMIERREEFMAALRGFLI